jgi:signal transduction histidine kinase
LWLAPRGLVFRFTLSTVARSRLDLLGSMLSVELLEHQLLDALPCSIYTLDLEARLTSVHAQAHHSESSTVRGVGEFVWNVVPAASRDEIEYAMRALRAGRAPLLQWELNIARDDAASFLAQMTPLHDDAHAVSAFALTVTDITSVARARDAAILSSLTLSRTLDTDRAFHSAALELRRVLRADTVIGALADGSTESPRLCYDYGVDGDRHELEERLRPDWINAMRRRDVITSRSDSTLTLTTAILGETRVLGVLSIAVDLIESPAELSATNHLLSSIGKHLGTAIERAESVDRDARQHRNAAIGEVAAGVAQELRNPIFGISSAAQLLRFRASQDPVMEKNVGRILREVERLNRMVTTLLELGRPAAVRLARIDPDTMWDGVLQTERGGLESRSIVVRRSRSELGVHVDADTEQLAQAFRNVLLNAVEAAPEASDITLSSSVADGVWRCRLTNGGPPIPSDMLRRVFEPFLSTKPGSTGVGLAIARRIVEDHHGTIAVESSSENGTTALISLPIRR